MQEIKENEDRDEAVNQVKIRKAKIDEIWNEFEQVQSAIEEEGNINEQEAHRIEFEETYFRATAAAESFIKKKRTKRRCKAKKVTILEAQHQSVSKQVVSREMTHQ